MVFLMRDNHKLFESLIERFFNTCIFDKNVIMACTLTTHSLYMQQ